MKRQKKIFVKKKKNNNKNNKYNKIKNIKDIQIKEESESDSVSIDEEENIIKNPLKNKDIKIKLYLPNISKNKNSITLLKIIIIYINKNETNENKDEKNILNNDEIKKSRTTSSNINASNKTLTRRLRDIVLNLCKVNSNAINKLEKKYGNEIINKIQSGQIDEETANNVENDLKHINRRASVIEDKFKQNIQKYLNDKEGLRGWEKLRSYLKVGDKEMKFKKLSAS